MPTPAGTLEVLSGGIARILQPLSEELDPAKVLDFFGRLGVQFPPALLTPPLTAALNTASESGRGLPAAVDQLNAAIAGNDSDQVLIATIDVIGRIVAFTASLVAVQDQLDSMPPPAGVTQQQMDDFVAELPGAILDYAIVRTGEVYVPSVTAILALVGLIDRVRVPGDPTNPTKPDYTTRRIRLDRLGKFLSNPLGYAEDLVGWGPAFNANALLQRVQDFHNDMAIPSTLGPGGFESYAFDLSAAAGSPPGVAFEIHVPITAGIDLTIPWCTGWAFHLLTEASADTTIDGSVRYPDLVEANAAADISGRALIGISRDVVPPATEIILIGQPGGSRISVASFRADAGVRFRWNSGSGDATVEPDVQGTIVGAKVIIDTSNADGFIGTLTSGIRVEGGFDAQLGWAPSTGIRFEGSATIEIQIPLHVSLGPIDISSLYLVGGISGGDSGIAIPLELSVGLGAKLGPLEAAVERIGAKAMVTFPEEGGNLGPANISFEFKPPSGVGLAVDAGVVKGGGYLYIDVERGEYAGALELTFSGFVSIKAIGIITTKMPDGSPGFSLLIIMWVEFASGIQLGFGFALFAVGGLLGLNRTMKLQALMEGVRSGAIDRIMFPQNIVANAPKIISDLRAIFPPQEGTFLIGPMVKLGWGTPTLISVTLGIIIEIPGNIAILGVIKIAAADGSGGAGRAAGQLRRRDRVRQEAALVLRRAVRVAGRCSSRSRARWDCSWPGATTRTSSSAWAASIPDSHRRRCRSRSRGASPISLINTSSARVRVEGYFAVTSNTRAVRRARRGVLRHRRRLEHQRPSRVRRAVPVLAVLLRHRDLRVALGEGVRRRPVQRPRQRLARRPDAVARGRPGLDLAAVLRHQRRLRKDVGGDEQGQAAADRSAADHPRGAGQGGDLARPAAGEQQPAGLAAQDAGRRSGAGAASRWGAARLAACPSARDHARQGRRPEAERRQQVDHRRGRRRAGPEGGRVRAFAPAQFQELSDADKLSRPAFSQERSGLELSAAGEDVRTGGMIRRVVRYEEIIIDSNFKRFVAPLPASRRAPVRLLPRRRGGGQIGALPGHEEAVQPFDDKIDVKEATYTVALQANNHAYSAAAATFTSEASAQEFLKSEVAKNPNARRVAARDSELGAGCMSILGTYSFLPWMRQGLANQITSPDPNPAAALRAEVQVQLELRATEVGGAERPGEPIDRNVALFGPGDIQGIEQRAIVRTDPRNWITNFEPNYLPCIEFYDEDFPWRYTPAAPAGARLRPWIMLVVLQENEEFEEGKDIRDKPLPYIEVPNADTVFPPPEQLWAWAHVHINKSVAANDTQFRANTPAEVEAVAPRVRSVIDANRDNAYSRILCPRKLAPNTAYHAFLVPVFETGRLAGLGLPFDTVPSPTISAWKDDYAAKGQNAPTQFPHYYRWYFRTGATGDFETLVRLLVPKPVDKRVGTRDMDVLDPGLNVDAEPKFSGILKLGGALRVPRKNYTEAELDQVEALENWATDPASEYPRPIQQDLAALINLSDDYAEAAADAANAAAGIIDPENPTENDPDPVITLPLYGTWHALTKRLLRERDNTPLTPNDNWIHELNLDPRFRVAAGFGTRVVQDQQEKLMDAAWEQVGRVLEARRRIRFGQFAKEVSTIWYDRHLVPLVGTTGTNGANRQKGLLLLAPLNKRVIANGFTVHNHLGESFLQPAMLSAPLRRILRPRGRLISLTPFTPEIRPDNLIDRVNEGTVNASPPKVRPPGILTPDDIADEVLPDNIPPALVEKLRLSPWLRWLLLLIAAILIILLFAFTPTGIAATVGIAILALVIWLFLLLTRWSNQIAASDTLREDNRAPERVDDLPLSPNFTLTDFGTIPNITIGTTDSTEAVRFKSGLKNAWGLITSGKEASVVPAKKKLDLGAIAETFVTAINPALTVPRRVYAGIFLPPRIVLEIGETFVEPMAYPIFDTPMYEPLTKPSAELFLPNLNLIEQNSITLLETNQKFIESYMVGLNHEFARELLWREYPTDQRGSYFRQFWDVRSFFNPTNMNDEDFRESLRDIPKLHLWSRLSKLGDHDHREEGLDNEQELVLVIRGELLKRYPNTVIYAHRARWQLKSDGTIDNTLERRLVDLVGAEIDKPPKDKVLTPLYEAKVDPDIYFFGFDLTIEAAAGGTGANPADDPGWFFVLKERPGEPRFGLDFTDPPPNPARPLHIWGDLAWSDVQPGPDGSFIEITNATPTRALTIPTGPDSEKLPQHDDDKNIPFNKDMNAADLAYVLFQAPVLVAIHASEMLPKN